MSALSDTVEYPVDPDTRTDAPNLCRRRCRFDARRERQMGQPGPAPSAVFTLYGLPDFVHADVYDLSGAPGFTGTPLPQSMFDADDDVSLGFLEPHVFGRLPTS